MRAPGDHEELTDPSAWGRRRRQPRRSWLRTARLNLAGWSALLGSCLGAGLLGVFAATAMGPPPAFGAMLAVVPVLAIVAVDRRRWARMQTSHGWGGSVEEVAQVAALLEARGVHAQVVPDDDPPSGVDPGPPHTAVPTPATASLHHLNRDADAVRKALRDKDIHPFRPR
ncbi:MAG: hypothetical protein JWP82_1835 [Humibacillus sp.]|nr:hypothetical protein [Humibacillus sp.]